MTRQLTSFVVLVFALVFLLVFLLAICGTAMAHQSRPLLFELDSMENQRLRLSWRLPDSLASTSYPMVSLSSSCRLLPGQSGNSQLTHRTGSRLYHCEHLQGLHLNLDYPGANPGIMTMVRGQLTIGQQTVELTELYSPSETHLKLIPDVSSLSASNDSWYWQYLKQGMIHIAKGYDHLLFVACLMLLAASPRRIFITVTGFTAAHSLTLALSSLKMVSVSVAATETVIAFSIVFLAAELIRSSKNSLTHRYPVLVAMLIGLLHGFGFASALQDVGLPENYQLLALMMFNIGVELGQLVFVVIALPILYGIKKMSQSALPTKTMAYGIGSMASYWALERLLLS